MRKTSVFFALCLALVLTLISCGGKVYTTGSGGGVSLDPVFKLTRDKIFLVGSEATGYQGTAFLVKYKGQRYLVTNFHVVSLLKDVFIETENNVSFKGVKVLAVNRNLDLAVLEAKNLPESLEGLSYSHDYSTSQKIFVVGYPDMRSKENHLNFVTGVISDANYLAPYYMGKGETRNIQITAPINPGNSGSPLLNEHGDAIGVIAWYYADKQAGNYAVPFSDVTNMFREIENRTADVKQIYHAGAACYSDDECQWLYFCIEGRCQELKDLGHNCKKNEDCYLPYNCFNGVCSRTGTTGDVCQNDSQCSPPSYCILGTCRPLSKKGEACKIDEDCVNPLYCILGKCVTSLSNLNEPCGQTIDCVKPYTCSGGVCKNVSGTYCNSDYQCSPQFCILGTCRDLGKYGDPCGKTIDCQSGLKCGNGKCEALSGLGGYCSADIDCVLPYYCAGGRCAEGGGSQGSHVGTYCTSDSQCTPPLYCILNSCRPLAQVGEACKYDEDCVNPLFCITGKCVTDLSGLNGPCAQTIDCKKPYSCLNGFCKNVSGSYCKSDYDCTPQFCILGSCRDLGNIGDPCGKTIDCQSGLKCSGGKCSELSGYGGSCSADVDCLLPYYCIKGKCLNESETVKSSNKGTPCTSDAQCLPPLYCILNRCMPLGIKGDACKIDDDCHQPLYCINGKCQY